MYCVFSFFLSHSTVLLITIPCCRELLWTTEKETLFFINKGLFGKAVTNVYQTIDLQQGLLNNLIEFESDRVFSVVGTIEKVLLLAVIPSPYHIKPNLTQHSPVYEGVS